MATISLSGTVSRYNRSKPHFTGRVSWRGLDDNVTPHTLRHTAATWLMQSGVDKWEAGGFLGMTVEMIDRVYGHHLPTISKQPRMPWPSAGAFHWQNHWQHVLRPAGLVTETIENIGGPGRTRTSNQTVMSGRL